MANMLVAYPYLFGTLILLGITFLGSRFFPKGQRPMIWLSGLANTPAFIFVIFLEGVYWAPGRVGGGTLGVEDPLIAFTVGAMAWLLAAWPQRQCLDREQNPGSPWRRYPWYSLSVAGVYLLLVWDRLEPMTALIVTLLLAWGVFLLKRPDLGTLSLTGGLLFPLGYYPCVRLVYWIWPDSVHQWNLKVFWGNLLGGVPVGELIWAIMFGACWPLFVGCVFQVRVRKADLGFPVVQRLFSRESRPGVLVCDKDRSWVRGERSSNDALE